MNKLKDIKLKNQLIISTYIMLFILFIFKPTLIPGIISKFITAFKPFIIGGVIAFLLNLPMKLIEEKIVRPLCKKNKSLSKMSRIISLVCTIVIVVILMWIFISYIVPQLADSLRSLTNDIPKYISGLQNEIMNKVDQLDMLKNTSFDIQAMIQKFLAFVQNFINMFISNVFNFTIGITNFFMNLFLGIIISMYILLSKEKLILQFKKLIYAFLNENKCERIMYILKLTNNKFSKFILGQSMDGLILGTAFFIVFSLLKIPFALLISIMIPILNFIPIFGTYVGIGISAFIILMVEPRTVLLFLFLVFTIQQLDGKFVYPFVVGNSLGLSPLWILLAIVVGGNLFGVVGMILGMPLTSVVYELSSKAINDRIKKKDITFKKNE
ncbi:MULTISPECIES: AI-2E family transporter [Terrisporobacter]|uniref:AI-2E family transporter n=1 Tax=Terrisporobacter TaxID=1505652 RepID=UPI00093CF143|nr:MULTISPECIES: AI-2E family transporter [Terrisporobacter]MCC3671145.1 AI-2E family transporter [Terrisporobacter mayombei]MDU6986278.1 AI-2E family transporter [Terrisporobacter othiniensis]